MILHSTYGLHNSITLQYTLLASWHWPLACSFTTCARDVKPDDVLRLDAWSDSLNRTLGPTAELHTNRMLYAMLSRIRFDFDWKDVVPLDCRYCKIVSQRIGKDRRCE